MCAEVRAGAPTAFIPFGLAHAGYVTPANELEAAQLRARKKECLPAGSAASGTSLGRHLD
jgi:hypothetical protein